MNNTLVLTDFSNTAFHAACYAAGLTLQLHTKELILYHAYEIPGQDSGATPQKSNDKLHAESMEKLTDLHHQLEKYLSNVTAVRCRAEGVNPGTSINDIAEDEDADLIVMGTTGKSALEQKLIGSTTIKVAMKSRYPVLIVPGNTALEPIRRILLACDKEQTTQLEAASDLQKILDSLSVPLMVVNVDHEKYSEIKTPLNTVLLHELLAAYHPSYHHTDNEDTVAGIMEFALANEASMIVLIPKNQGFLEGLFHRSVTKKLAFHTSIPLLVLHENKISETEKASNGNG